MMTLYDLTKKYGQGNGEGMMWKTIRIVSDSIDSGLDEHAKSSLMRKVFGEISDKHYDEELARADVACMYYEDADGNEHKAPYWSDDAVMSIFEDVQDKIPDYNEWDFYVVMNMIQSDNICMLKRWYPNYGNAELNDKVSEMAVNWLDDKDWPTKTKIWDYLSAR